MERDTQTHCTSNYPGTSPMWDSKQTRNNFNSEE